MVIWGHGVFWARAAVKGNVWVCGPKQLGSELICVAPVTTEEDVWMTRVWSAT